jgi:hypothetical protein
LQSDTADDIILTSVKWLFVEPESERAEAVLQSRISGDFELVASEIVPAEVENAIWKSNVSRWGFWAHGRRLGIGHSPGGDVPNRA